MGLLDRFRRSLDRRPADLRDPLNRPPIPAEPQPPIAPARPPGRHASRRDTAPHPSQYVAPVGPWLPPGTGIVVAGLNIVGGLLYVGSGLRAVSGSVAEPALIDPRLPVDHRRPDWAGHELDYWPSYDAVSPAARAAYLSWLADGRRHPEVPIGYVFLYLYGLERRALYELWGGHPAAEHELPIIREEVRRLTGLFPGQASFQRYTGEFEQLLDVMTMTARNVHAGPVPAPAREGAPPARLRVGLGEFAAFGLPIPAEWALSWLRSDPEYRLRTVATRCPDEFDGLFRLRYTSRHGPGIKVRPGGEEIALEYRPASSGFRGAAKLTLSGTTDVLKQAGPLRKLAAIADECAAELDTYSRFVGRVPEERASLRAKALLPVELVDFRSGEVGRAVSWARDRLGRRESAIVRAEEFAAFIAKPGVNPTKKDALGLIRLLGVAEVGVEPDPGLGGPIPFQGPMVLFRTLSGPPPEASEAYQTATLLLHLAAAVAESDGVASEAEHRHLVDHLERSLHLTGSERRRLGAHLSWLMATKVKLSGLTRRIAMIDDRQRAYVAEFLAGVAAADGEVSTPEVKTLTRIHRLLGLDQPPAVVPSPPRPATPYGSAAPTGVRPGEPERVYVVEPEPATAPMERIPAQPERAVPALPSQVRLDPEAIKRKLAETEQVNALLGRIFAEEEETAAPVDPATVSEEPVAGLNAQHSGLLRTLAGGHELSRARFTELAARWNLLPDGAMDQVNEAAYELVGEPLLEGDDPISVNQYVFGEMLS
ncbi:TerB N-terminal domain-containing protein [Rhizohabitans arisaemae]|uniref:tellurite resistance TerB family protein n=1 Tax=Rhizohabitans arisaemae TaxID=2720610 RepID=UPI0024B133D9|nr:TerB N-terminal domain-containing protein [Rhizohabitans arisaemae]